MKLLLLAMVLTPVQTKPCKINDVTSAGLLAVICTEGSAKKLEASKEPARDIAIAAVEECSSVFRLMDQEAAACDFDVRSFRATIRGKAIDAAIAKVIQIRASRPQSSR